MALIRIEQLPLLEVVTSHPVCVVTVFFPTFFLVTILVVLQAPFELMVIGIPDGAFIANLAVFLIFKLAGTLGRVCAFKTTVGLTATGGG